MLEVVDNLEAFNHAMAEMQQGVKRLHLFKRYMYVIYMYVYVNIVIVIYYSYIVI